MAGMHSFDGATFTILRGQEDRTREADVSVRRVPGGDVTVIDLGGVGPERLSVPILLADEAEYQALRAKVGVQGTLVWAEGTHTAILVRLGAGNVYPSGQRQATAEFLLL